MITVWPEAGLGGRWALGPGQTLLIFHERLAGKPNLSRRFGADRWADATFIG
jgi:hypothetical protein